MKYKAFLIFVFVCLFSVMYMLPVSSQDIEPPSFGISSEEKAALTNPEYHKPEMENIDLTQPIIRLYGDLSFVMLEEYDAISDIIDIENSTEKVSYDYILLGNKIRRIYWWFEDGENKVGVAETYEENVEQYMLDLNHMNCRMIFFGKECLVEEVYCFDGRPSYMGTAVFFITNQGTFVKYYRGVTDEVFLFTEDEFRAYGKKYLAYCEEKQYDENGELLIGLNLFWDYMSEHYPGVGTFVEETISTEELLETIAFTENLTAAVSSDEGCSDNETPDKIQVLVVAGISGIVLLLFIGFIVAWGVKKKRL